VNGSEPLAQLPAAPPYFVGREDELARLTADLDRTEGGTVLISALAGAGGIGKTALALHWAHRNLSRFPDGQLFVDLQGFSPAGEPVDPAVAVRGFLDAFGIEAGRIPAAPSAQAALYRSLVAGKRMLIVLDNAADGTQVVPLLPGSDSCKVLVTSRRRLTSLITHHGAHHLPLGVLTEGDARELLMARLGVPRTSAESEAVNELIACCGGFALALAIIAGRAAMNPTVPLAELATELREATTRLTAFDDDEPTVSLPAVLSWSLRVLTQKQVEAFGLLGIAPGPDISLPAAANLLGLSLTQARRVLRALAEASLLNVDVRGRYSMHDLIRDHATETVRSLKVNTSEAMRQLIDFYLHTAYAADRLFYPYRAPIQLASPAPGVQPHPPSTAPEALAWFDTEHANLLGIQHTAVELEWHQATWQLAWALTMFHSRQGHRDHRLAMWRVALTAAGQVSDPAARTLIHRNLGRANAEAGRHDEALEHLHEALALAERHDDIVEQAYVHTNLAWAWEIHGDYRHALIHGKRGLHFSKVFGNPVWEADALNAVSLCAALLGDYEWAREHSEVALTMHRHHHHRQGESVALFVLGYIDLNTDHHDRAVDYYQQATEMMRDIGNAYDAPDAITGLGSAYAALGDHSRAREAWQEALEMYRQQRRVDKADQVQQSLDTLDGLDSAREA
jgi:tetratricopeptide (TPR) repeat protein